MSESAKLSILLEMSKNKYDTISAADNTLDAKSTGLLAFVLALVTLIGGFFGNSLTQKPAAGLGYLLFILSGIMFLIAAWPRRYYAVIGGITEIKKYAKMQEGKLIRKLIGTVEESTIKNRKILEHKARFFNLALCLLISGVIVFICLI